MRCKGIPLLLGCGLPRLRICVIIEFSTNLPLILTCIKGYRVLHVIILIDPGLDQEHRCRITNMRFEFIGHLFKRFEKIRKNLAIAFRNRILFSFHNVKFDTAIVRINNHFNRISDIVAPRFRVALCIRNLSSSFANELFHRNSIGVPMRDGIGINYPNEPPIMDNNVRITVISQEGSDFLNPSSNIPFIEDSAG